MTDTAVVNFAAPPYSVELRHIPKATIKADEVLLEVQAVGVCGSDLHMWADTPSWQVNYPIVLGHEFAGVIREVGDNASGFSPGDRVVSETHARLDPNGPMSRRGHYHLDPSRGGFGAAVDGAMRHFVAVPARIVHRLPDHVPFPVAALTEPSCVAYNAVVHNSRIRVGDRVVVFGPGPIGLLCSVVARLHGAHVAVVGLPRDASRLEVARQLGCEAVVGDPTEWSRAADGLGADGVIDATGVSASLEVALRVVRPEGWITKVGWGHQPLDFSLDPLVQKNVTLQGSFSHYWPIWERVLEMLSTGQLDVRPMIGGTWPLEEWEDAFRAMHTGEVVKAVLQP
jgi:alcohol dehydrogenase/L-iditol 2-dehydrogenase